MSNTTTNVYETTTNVYETTYKLNYKLVIKYHDLKISNIAGSVGYKVGTNIELTDTAKKGLN